jgi:hypothetical protein
VRRSGPSEPASPPWVKGMIFDDLDHALRAFAARGANTGGNP